MPPTHNATNITCHIDIFFDGSTLWNCFQHSNGYDIIFMDIEMITDGNSTAREICANNFDTIIIYISSYTSYFQELFDVEPFRFIQKPIKKDIFSSYLSLAVKRVLSGRQVYPFHFCKAFYAIPIKEIVYFESRLHIIIIHCENNNSYQYGKLNLNYS